MLDQFYWKIKQWFIFFFLNILTTVKSSSIKKWEHLINICTYYNIRMKLKYIIKCTTQ